ncbi:flavin reductase family protein [Martelella alba]|uniref:Flavin reductase family protein n=2 Tax=Martelella alba TaxID=2590451 RepID=A0A506U9R4_9HYPH|nr:flavin reductase family protein [Martelella alba]
MAHYAGHVQVVTTASGGALRGVTATACCSVSDDPPTVLACVNRHNARNVIFQESGNFAVNSLSSEQQPLADLFSGRTGVENDERFDHAVWEYGVSGAPILAGTMATFDCQLIEAREMATHFVLFGAVQDVRIGSDREPLLYFGRAYRRLVI